MRPQFINVQTFHHFFEWLKSRLDGKASAVHEHASLATKTELSAVADGLADPVILMSETTFAGITPDPGKIYIVYGE